MHLCSAARVCQLGADTCRRSAILLKGEAGFVVYNTSYFLWESEICWTRHKTSKRTDTDFGDAEP